MCKQRCIAIPQVKKSLSKTLQISTFGDDVGGILIGLQNFSIHKLILLHYIEDKKQAKEFAENLRNTIGMSISLKPVTRSDVIRSTMKQISEIIHSEQDSFEQILINISAGDKMMGCAALFGAFVNGIKAFVADTQGHPILLPIMKLSYDEIISESKIKILQTLDKIGGIADSMEDLAKHSGYGKSLLSYHIKGNAKSNGLVQLGLVDIERLEGGRNRITINTLGRMLISVK